MDPLKNAILEKTAALGFDACRITTAAPPDSAGRFLAWLEEDRHGAMAYLQRNAPKRVDPQQVLPGAQTILALAVNYADAPELAPQIRSTDIPAPTLPTSSAPAPHCGRIACYARYRDYHDVLGERLKDLTEFINTTGGPGTRSLWYVDTGPMLERDLAQRAGLGFVGKHTNLISRSLGNWIFLSEILTTLVLEPDEPERNHCGHCTRCLQACPTQAITAPFQLDARRCISYLTIELKGPIPEEFRAAIGDRIYGCDDCLEACPWNRFAREAFLMKPHRLPELCEPDLRSLLELDEIAFKRMFAGTPILRTKRRGFLRNVCVALGNVGDATDLPALQRAALDPEPLIAEHAHWAIREIESRRLQKL